MWILFLLYSLGLRRKRKSTRFHWIVFTRCRSKGEVEKRNSGDWFFWIYFEFHVFLACSLNMNSSFLGSIHTKQSRSSTFPKTICRISKIREATRTYSVAHTWSLGRHDERMRWTHCEFVLSDDSCLSYLFHCWWVLNAKPTEIFSLFLTLSGRSCIN